jgi:hypothetical protein
VGIALLGLLAGLYVVGGLTGLPLPPVSGARVIPFVTGDAIFPFVAVGAVLAVALALRQTVGELVNNTFEFLLHRPARREALLAVKLATGLGWCVVCTLVPVLLYAWWAATPGNHASPFQWSMTLPVFRALAVLSVLYLTAFLSGLRPASWFGTRVVPLIGGGMLAVLLYAIPWSWGLGLLLLVLVDALIVDAIFSVAQERDY